MTWNLTIILLGLIFSRILFFRFPFLAGKGPGLAAGDISVIIPARNEESNLPHLLADLRGQTMPPMEILCVDDGSEDGTREAILAGGATLLDAGPKPENWMGKAWACQVGAAAAAGQRLLFLDADVRLAPEALASLSESQAMEGGTLSVQPYHRVIRAFEHCSFFFNLVMVAANGVCLARAGHHIGLFGPAILMPREDYNLIGGHESARESIADDLALGRALARAGKPYRLLLGGHTVSFRMYGEGLRALIQGWTKNYATGAATTHPVLLFPAILWVTSCFCAPLNLALSLPDPDLTAVVYGGLSLVWVAELARISRKLGNFSWGVLAAYPLFLLLFIGVFLLSLAKKVLGLEVTWKGRRIRPVK